MIHQRLPYVCMKRQYKDVRSCCSHSEQRPQEDNCSTVDTDVVVLAVSAFEQLGVDEFWLDFGVGKHLKYIASYLLAQAIGSRKSKCLLFFHALTFCDTTSSFLGHGKRCAWEIWVSYPEASDSFKQICKALEKPSTSCLPCIERLAILLYD